MTVARHYRSNPKKEGKDFRYVFRIIDIEAGMYVGFGYSDRSEKDVFENAMKMLKSMGVRITRFLWIRITAQGRPQSCSVRKQQSTSFQSEIWKELGLND